MIVHAYILVYKKKRNPQRNGNISGHIISLNASVNIYMPGFAVYY